MSSKITATIKDKHGRIVIWQMPNLLLWCWIVLRGLMFIFGRGKLQAIFEQLSNAVLFAWSYLEITQGVTTFRKVLGSVVMVPLVLGIILHP